MKTKKCSHNSFWQIYKIINFSSKFSDVNWRNFICKICGAKCVMKWRGYKKLQKSWMKKYVRYFLWLLPAILVIYWAVNWYIGYINGMLIITVFHFVSMYYIIKSDRLKISVKK
jgi:hypothetical protein